MKTLTNRYLIVLLFIALFIPARPLSEAADTRSSQQRFWNRESTGGRLDSNAIINAVNTSAYAISAGKFHTCAAIVGGGMKCWGNDFEGQLGNGLNLGPYSTPVDVIGLGGTVNKISAGGYHTCALLENGAVQCWGNNDYGQLGDGTNTAHFTPVSVQGLAARAIKVVNGEAHSCALLETGGVKCWGINWQGELGDGTTTNRWTPVDVTGLTSDVIDISSSSAHTCAVISSHGVMCWGSNGHGQLGDGTTTDRYSPVVVLGLTNNASKVSAGGDHTCAATLAGGAKCWGYNFYGQLGDGTTQWSYTPVDVVGIAGWVDSISVGFDHSCALTSSGGMKCWGGNYEGQIGDGTNTARFIPVDVAGLASNVAVISAGWWHTCAITSRGQAKCWGKNSDYQLGIGIYGDQNTPMNVVGVDGGSTGYVDITWIEFNQATQDEANNVPLIAEKPALARVYVDCVLGCSAMQTVSGSLEVTSSRGSSTLSPVNGPVTAYNPGEWSDQRGSLHNTLNFQIPTNLLNGDVTFTARIMGTTLSVTKNFQPGQKMNIAWMNIGYENGNGVVTFANGQIAHTGDVSLRKIYPLGINDLNYFYQPGLLYTESKFACDPVCTSGQYFSLLNDFWNRINKTHGWRGGVKPDRLFGWVPDAARVRSGNWICGAGDGIWAGGLGRAAVGTDYCDKPFGKIFTPGEVFAHEMGHILNDQGLRHTPNPDHTSDTNCLFSTSSANLDYPNSSGKLDEFGIDPSNYKLLKPWNSYDFMAYCQPGWVSMYNYQKMLGGFDKPKAPIEADGMVNQPTRQLLVSGSVISDTMTAKFDPFYEITSDDPPDANQNGDYCFELHDNGDNLLDSRCLKLSFMDPEEGTLTNEAFFAASIPFPDGTKSILLKHLGQILVSIPVSEHAPTVQLISPNGGENWAGDGKYTITWAADDPDGEDLHYALEYSTDSGVSWFPIGLNLTDTSQGVDLSRLPGGSTILLRISATDGVNTTYDPSDGIITVGKKAPEVSIYPIDGSTLPPETPIYLQGTAYDLEDGTLPDSAMSWSSDIDGALGSGKSILVVLSYGEHKITLNATDSDGNIGTDTLIVFAGYRGYLPMMLKK